MKTAKELKVYRTLITRGALCTVALLTTVAAPSEWRMIAQRAAANAQAPFALTFRNDLRLASERIVGNTITVSPDGKLVAFVRVDSPNFTKLYVRPLSDENSRPLAVYTEGASQPFFSPDSKWLGFLAAGGKLRKIPAEGGTAIPIATLKGLPRGISWGPDDIIVFSSENHLEVVRASGGEPQTLTTLDRSSGEEFQRWPLVLNDGKTVLYASAGPRSPLGPEIRAVSLATGHTQMLALHGTAPLAVIDGRLIYVATDESLMAVPFDTSRVRVTGTPIVALPHLAVEAAGVGKAGLSQTGTLVYQELTFSTPLVVVNDRGDERTLLDLKRISFPRLSPDGRRIALSVEAPTGTDIWVYEIASGSLRRLTSEGQNTSPEWTPDGARILFASTRAGATSLQEGSSRFYAEISTRAGAMSLWWQPADGSGKAELLEASADEGVLSPDGRTLIYSARSSQNQGDIWFRALDGDTRPRPVATSASSEMAPRVSPDGHWVAYTSNESGQREVYVQSFPDPGSRFQVSLHGGMTPVWSRDGRRIFYTNEASGYFGPWQVFAATVMTTPTFGVSTRARLGDYFLNPGQRHANYDAWLDSTQLLMLKLTNQTGRTLVVPNWGSELRMRTPPKPR